MYYTLSVSAPDIVKFPEAVHVMEGEKVVFQVEVTGAPEPKVMWYHNGEEVVGDYSKEMSEDGSLTMPSAEAKHSGVYQLVAHNMAGRVKREVKLTVQVVEDKIGRSTPQPQRQTTGTALPVASFGNHVEKNHTGQNQAFKDEYQVYRVTNGRFHQVLLQVCVYTYRACMMVMTSQQA